MHELTQPLTESEKFVLGDELETLFVLQDRPTTDKKRAVMVRELAELNVPMAALVAGIRKLRDDESRLLTFSKIKAAAVSAWAASGRQEPVRIDCGDCHGGLVAMVRWNPGKDHHLNRTSFACICANGETVRKWKKSPAAWNGQTDQGVNGVDFKRHDHRGIYQ